MTIFSKTTTVQLLGIAERQAKQFESYFEMTDEKRQGQNRTEKGETIIGAASFQIHIFISALRELKSRSIPIDPWEWILEEADSHGV